jgi:hypothetical protein
MGRGGAVALRGVLLVVEPDAEDVGRDDGREELAGLTTLVGDLVKSP